MRTRSVLALTLTSALVLTLLGESAAMAVDGDVTPPVLTSLSQSAPGPFVAGDSVAVDFVATDDAIVLDHVTVTLKDSAGGLHALTTASGTDTSVSTTIDSTWALGHVTVSAAEVADEELNTTTYTALSAPSLLSGVAFDVLGTLVPAVPTFEGTPAVGKKLTAVEGTWEPEAVTFAYQWFRAGVAISGATTSQYVVTTADAGQELSVTVEGTLSGYAPATASSATLLIQQLLSTTPKPKITGTKKVGATLKATAGTWAPTGVALTYQWKRNGTAITGATAKSYTLVKADAGKKITVTVTGSKTAFTPVSKTSAPAPIQKLLTTKKPTISGSTTVGKKLTATAGKWGPGKVKVAYKWYRNGKAISGATSKTYTTKKADVGKSVTVKVTGKKSGYTTASKTSSAKKIKAKPVKSSRPSSPGDTKNCSDFSTHAAAQAWFEKYYPYYGDVARLDGDNDMLACVNLP